MKKNKVMFALTAIKDIERGIKNTLKSDKRQYLCKNGKTLKRKSDRDFLRCGKTLLLSWNEKLKKYIGLTLTKL